jgi:hypothetical protein
MISQPADFNAEICGESGHSLARNVFNMLGRHSFVVSEFIARGELRPLRNPNQEA